MGVERTLLGKSPLASLFLPANSSARFQGILAAALEISMVYLLLSAEAFLLVSPASAACNPASNCVLSRSCAGVRSVAGRQDNPDSQASRHICHISKACIGIGHAMGGIGTRPLTCDATPIRAQAFAHVGSSFVAYDRWSECSWFDHYL